MEVGIGDDYMIVNEMRIEVTPDTAFWSQNRQPTSILEVRKDQWVYIEALKSFDEMTAEKVYLIPHYITGKEKDKYPFIP